MRQPGPKAITRDQEFLAALLEEMRLVNQRLIAIDEKLGAASSEHVCEECGRGFASARALIGHTSKMHKEQR